MQANLNYLADLSNKRPRMPTENYSYEKAQILRALNLSSVVGEYPFTYNNGEIKSGTIENGRLSSVTVIHPEGDIFEGDLNGRGKVTRLGKEILTGIFHEGAIQNGTGEFICPNNAKYKGEIVDGKPHGTGQLTFPDESQYKGQFVEGIIRGHGVKTYSDGSVYNGDFDYGIKNGKGILTNSDGSSYKGNFEKGLMHGQGVLKDKEGNVIF